MILKFGKSTLKHENVVVHPFCWETLTTSLDGFLLTFDEQTHKPFTRGVDRGEFYFSSSLSIFVCLSLPWCCCREAVMTSLLLRWCFDSWWVCRCGRKVVVSPLPSSPLPSPPSHDGRLPRRISLSTPQRLVEGISIQWSCTRMRYVRRVFTSKSRDDPPFIIFSSTTSLPLFPHRSLFSPSLWWSRFSMFFVANCRDRRQGSVDDEAGWRFNFAALFDGWWESVIRRELLLLLLLRRGWSFWKDWFPLLSPAEERCGALFAHPFPLHLDWWGGGFLVDARFFPLPPPPPDGEMVKSAWCMDSCPQFAPPPTPPDGKESGVLSIFVFGQRLFGQRLFGQRSQ